MAHAGSTTDLSPSTAPHPLDDDQNGEEDASSSLSGTEPLSSDEGDEDDDKDQVDPVYARDLDSEFADLLSQLQTSAKQVIQCHKSKSLLKLSLLTSAKPSSVSEPSASISQTELDDQTDPSPLPVPPKTSSPPSSSATLPTKAGLAKKCFLPPLKKKTLVPPVEKEDDTKGKEQHGGFTGHIKDIHQGKKSTVEKKLGHQEASLKQKPPLLSLQQKERAGQSGKKSSPSASIPKKPSPSLPSSHPSSSSSPLAKTVPFKTGTSTTASSTLPKKSDLFDAKKKDVGRPYLSPPSPLMKDGLSKGSKGDELTTSGTKRVPADVKRVPGDARKQQQPSTVVSPSPRKAAGLPLGKFRQEVKKSHDIPRIDLQTLHEPLETDRLEEEIEEEENGEQAEEEETEESGEFARYSKGQDILDAPDDEDLLSRIEEEEYDGENIGEAEGHFSPRHLRSPHPFNIMEVGSEFEEEEDFQGQEDDGGDYQHEEIHEKREEDLRGYRGPSENMLRMRHEDGEDEILGGEVEEEDGDAQVEASGEGVIEGDVLLDEIIPIQEQEEEGISSDSDIEELDHRWGMLASDYRWERQREQRRYRYTQLLVPSDTASYIRAGNHCHASNARDGEAIATTGIHAPPYRTLYRRPKDYEVGVTYLQRYQLPTVSRLLKTPAPEFIRKRPEDKVRPREISRICEIDGALRFEVELISRRRKPGEARQGTVIRHHEEEEEKQVRFERGRERAEMKDRIPKQTRNRPEHTRDNRTYRVTAHGYYQKEKPQKRSEDERGSPRKEKASRGSSKSTRKRLW